MSIRFYPFNDFVREYANEYIKFKSKRTQERDLETIKLFIKLFPNIEYVKDFNDIVLKEFIKIRQKNGKQNGTINRELITLKHMQRIAYQKKYFDENITLKTKFLPTNNNTETYIPTDEEIQYIYNKINEPLKTAFVLGLSCGMRSGEVCHIELKDIDFNKDTISIRPKPHLEWKPKNNTSIRDVPIHPDFKNYLIRRYNFAKKAKSNLLCCYEDGHALTEAVISALIGKIRRKDNNIDKRFHFHCLRHKFITLTGNSGIPMIQIKNIVGHANLKLTESVYYHNSNEKNLESIKTVSIPLKVKK